MAKRTTTLKADNEIKKATGRAAGILLHITSLPSSFGIGDLGPEAIRFADFLGRSGQRFWQLLPLNPTGPEQAYSPYSSTCSMAGNTLLISLEVLVDQGLLSQSDVRPYRTTPGEKVNFKKASNARNRLLPLAYEAFGKTKKQHPEFQQFCSKQAFWLDDFSLYVVLKAHQNGKPWYQWPNEIRKRNAKALKQFAKDNAPAIRYQQWLQYIFFQQWSALKTRCNRMGIQMFGDIPFYVSYDSSDVWSNPTLFTLDSSGRMKGVAGVPPDYFNSDGQLWGMPTFQWENLKRTGYRWWIERIRTNIELFDVLRLDHFRAFADYWEVPAGHKNAKKGKWMTGPRDDFFIRLNKALGDLPFIAEDLGDINDEVYRLRDDFQLPGMKVLQFAFGDTVPTSDYIPHRYTPNFLVYTGTHDNNTTRGWYRKDIGAKERAQLSTYSGIKVDEKNVSEVLARLAYASTAQTAIIPLQDLLSLDEKARMNTPASTNNNWQWRFKAGSLTRQMEKKLKDWVWIFGRGGTA